MERKNFEYISWLSQRGGCRVCLSVCLSVCPSECSSDCQVTWLTWSPIPNRFISTWPTDERNDLTDLNGSQKMEIDSDRMTLSFRSLANVIHKIINEKKKKKKSYKKIHLNFQFLSTFQVYLLRNFLEVSMTHTHTHTHTQWNFAKYYQINIFKYKQLIKKDLS